MNINELSEKKLNELIDEYYSGIKTKDLIRKYKLNCSPTSIYKYFPPKVYDNYICEFCGSYLVLDRVSRTNKLPRYESELYCPKCNHRPYITMCNCENCNSKRKRQQEEKRQLIYDIYKYSTKEVSFDFVRLQN